MAREPKPWYRHDRGVWCVTIGGRRHNLGPDKKDAMQRFYALMRRPKPVQKVAAASLPGVVDAFLDWCSRNRSEATYRWYVDRLQDFVSRHPKLTFERLTPLLVEQWAADGYDNVNSRRNRLRAVKRCLRWATINGLVETNPVAAVEIPAGQPRETHVPVEEFERLLGFVRDPTFVELLRVTYETGCRPQESLRLEARHCDFEHARWVFPRSEAKVKSKPRIALRRTSDGDPNGQRTLCERGRAVAACLEAAVPPELGPRLSHTKMDARYRSPRWISEPRRRRSGCCGLFHHDPLVRRVWRRPPKRPTVPGSHPFCIRALCGSSIAFRDGSLTRPERASSLLPILRVVRAGGS